MSLSGEELTPLYLYIHQYPYMFVGVNFDALTTGK